MTTAGDISIGAGAVGDLFGGIFAAKGDAAEAKAYKTAAGYASQNAVIAQEAGNIKMEQTGRQIYKTLGAQQVGYASAGLTGGGSAQEVLRDSVAQGSMEKAIVNEQTQINVTGYKAQAAQFAGMASAASAASKGSLLGGIIKAGVTLLPLLASDRRLKTDIEPVGQHGALTLYRYRFLWDDIGTKRIGVMADEVATHAPHALGPVVNGYLTVDYGALGLAHLVKGQALAQHR